MNFSTNKNLKILVIGDLMIDHYIYGDCNRISPEAPVQVVDIKNDEYTLGGAGNVVKNLKSLECFTDVIAVVGNDENAAIVSQHLGIIGVTDDGIVKDNERCTTLKSRVLVNNHQLIRLDREVSTPISEETAIRLSDIIKNSVAKYNIVLLSDYNKGMLSEFFLNRILQICRQAGVKTIVDPKGNNYAKYKGANIIKPNKKEAMQASGVIIKDRESLQEACLKIKEITQCDDVIVTMSEEGMAMFTNDKLDVIPTKAMDVADVTGAGDTVLASLGFALALDNTLHEACDFANHAAAVVVSKVGSATVTLAEINKVIFS